MLPDISIRVELKAGVDALYVTRLQKERQAPIAKEQELKKSYPVVDKKLLEGEEFKKTLVMHPLPRVDELAHEVDADPRSMYFKQAAYGMPVRMALLALLLGAKEVTITEEEDSFITEIKYIRPEFKIMSREPLTLRCIYCDHELHPQYIASSDWHEGKLETKKYHSADSHWAWKIKPENLIIFASEKEARAQQFKPSRYVKR